MSYAYVITYRGRCDDPEAFVDYYVKHHLPIVWTFPGIRRIEVDRGVEGEDFFLSARLTFDTLDELRAALVSPQREPARADMANFPHFEGVNPRHTVEVLEIPRERP